MQCAVVSVPQNQKGPLLVLPAAATACWCGAWFWGWAVGAGLQERPAWCALCCWRHGEKSVCREYTSVTQGASVMLLTVKGPFPAAALSCLGCGVKTCETAAVHCFWAQLAGWAAPQQTKGERGCGCCMHAAHPQQQDCARLVPCLLGRHGPRDGTAAL